MNVKSTLILHYLQLSSNQQSKVNLILHHLSFVTTEHADSPRVDFVLSQKSDERIEQDSKQLPFGSNIKQIEVSAGPSSEFCVEMNNTMPTKLRIFRKKRYCILPIYSNESDLDVSDKDPTYDNEAERSDENQM